MYTYRNTRTGVQFVSACECFGKGIEKVSPPEAAAPETPPETPPETKKKGKKKSAAK